MAKAEVLRLFEMLSQNPIELERLSSRNFPELLFHTKAMAYDFNSEDLTSVVGDMEWYIITEKDKEELNAYSSLWQRMWGKSRLDYIVNVLYKNLNDNELAKIIEN